MTQFSASVDIALPLERTFTLYTDARLAGHYAAEKHYAEIIKTTKDGIGMQVIWTTIQPDFKTEMLETVLERDAPHRIASLIQITRVLALQPHEVTPGIQPMTAYDLRGDYSPIYGKLPVDGAIECLFEPSDRGTRLSIEMQMQLGGLARFTGWFQSRKARNPMQADLEAFRNWAETTDAQPTINS